MLYSSQFHELFPPAISGAPPASTPPSAVSVDIQRQLLEAWNSGWGVFPAAELVAGTMALADRLASMRPLAMRVSKLVTRASVSHGEFASLRFSDFAEAMLKSSDTRHSAEVYRAFAEKRRPAMGP